MKGLGLVEPPKNKKSDKIQMNLYNMPIIYYLDEKLDREELADKIITSTEFQRELRSRFGVRNYKRILRELNKGLKENSKNTETTKFD